MKLWKRTRGDSVQVPGVHPDTVPAVQSDTDKDLWWVQFLLNVGRPVVAVFVLVMCAPGEHYLALEAGWNKTLAWGMPGTLTAYAGIAAVVATKRSKGTPGRRTAVWGAIASIALAMAAQPIAHLYGRPGLTTQQVYLVVAVSCIPALVFGHLLHMAASGVRVRVSTPDVRADSVPELSGLDAAVQDAQDELSTRSPLSVAVSTPVRDMSGDVDTEMDAQDIGVQHLFTDMSRPYYSDDAATWTPGQDTDMSDLDTTLSGWTAREVSGETIPVRDVVQINRPGVPAVVRAVLTEDKDATDTDIHEAVHVQLGPDIPYNTIYKAIARTRKRMDIPAIKEA